MPGKPRATSSPLVIVAIYASAIVFTLSVSSLAAALMFGRSLPWQLDLPAVSIHIGAALAGIALAVVQVVLPKGGSRHQILGYIWCAVMSVVAVSSFAIQLDPDGGVTLIHGLSSLFSIATLVLIPLVVHYGQRWKRSAHRKALLAIFVFILMAGALSFLPDRTFGDLVAAILTP